MQTTEYHLHSSDTNQNRKGTQKLNTYSIFNLTAKPCMYRHKTNIAKPLRTELEFELWKIKNLLDIALMIC